MYTKFLLSYLISFCFLSNYLLATEEYVTVEKGNVVHKFAKMGGGWLDDFTANSFKYWENDTFSIFEVVKDKDGIAIDLGAWIGTTSIWLSKNFFYVIAVEADRESIKYLEKNFVLSECSNVVICPKAVMSSNEPVLFGPRLYMGDALNLSTSCIKKMQDSSNDSAIPAITFDQIIKDYVTANNKTNGHKVTFIKCDIEGGEENILEDILKYAHANNCKAWISFHLDWWNSKQITDFEQQFANFKTNCPSENICDYIKQNPFASLLFTPITDK